MHKIKIVGLAIVAVLAFGVVSVSSASAAEWLGKEGGALKKLTVAKKVNSEATLVLSSNGTELECEGMDRGTVGPGAADETTEVLNKALTSKVVVCKILKPGLANCTAPAEAEAVNLPWKTKLVSATDDQLESSGAGNPGWKVKCGNGATNTCTKATAQLAVTNNGLTVGLAFNATEVATCTLGTGKVSGTDTVVANEAGLEGLEVK
jgi:hypothetical protein